MARGDGYRTKQLDLCREKIKTSQLLNRLQDNALAAQEFMTAGQIRSAEIALSKSLPSLQSVEAQVTNVQPFAVLPNEIKDIAAWEQAANPKNTEETQH